MNRKNKKYIVKKMNKYKIRNKKNIILFAIYMGCVFITNAGVMLLPLIFDINIDAVAPICITGIIAGFFLAVFMLLE